MNYQNLHFAARKLHVFILLVTILNMSLSAASKYDHTYYVTPNVSSCTNVNGTCQVFKMYFNNASYYFQSGTEFIFLPGVHDFNLGSFLSVQDVVNIHLVGSDNFTQRSVAEDVEAYGFDPYAYDSNISYLQSSTIILCANTSAILFCNVTNLTIENLTLLNCGRSLAALNTKCSIVSYSIGIYMSDVYNVMIAGLSIQNSTGYGLYGLNVSGQSHIMRTSFGGNNQFVKAFLQHMPIKNCKNEPGSRYKARYANSGGNLFFNLSSSSHLYISFVHIVLGIDDGNVSTGGLTLFGSIDKSIDDQSNVNIDNLVIYRNHGILAANFYFTISHMTITNMFSAYATSVRAGGLYAPSTHSLLRFKNSIFECNFSEQGDGSTLYIIPVEQLESTNVTFENCTFIQDQSRSSLCIQSSNLELTNSSFYDSNIYVNRSHSKINNSVLQFGVYMHIDSEIHMYNSCIHVQTEVIFLNCNVYCGTRNHIQSTIIAMFSFFP